MQSDNAGFWILDLGIWASSNMQEGAIYELLILGGE